MGIRESNDSKCGVGRLFRYDLRWGIAAQWKKLTAVVVFSLIAGLYLYVHIVGLKKNFDVSTDGTFMDYLLNMFHGMKRFVASSGGDFEIPITFLGISILTAFTIGNYTVNDLSACGIQIITRSRSRTNWIISKILWNFTAVIMIYLCIVIVAYIFGGGGIVPTELICSKILDFSNINAGGISNMTLCVLVILLPLVTSMAVSQLQMTISLIVSPVAGFFVAITIMFLSAYITSPYLLGNYWMIQRNSIFLNGGMNMVIGFAVNVIVIVVAVICDIFYFKRKNII